MRPVFSTTSKLPVGDLEQSFAWYQRTLGCQRSVEFVEQGPLSRAAMPGGGGS
jgi:hypothetical protein